MSEAIGLMPKEDAIALITKSAAFHPNSLNTAIWIAATALHGQKTWDGNDYDSHYLRVGMNNTMSDAKRIIGVLHDVIEDTKGKGAFEWTLDDLRRTGFSERIIQGVDAVTKRENEGYFTFIERGSMAGEDTIDVKMNDLKDNMDTSRNNGPDTEHSRIKNAAYRISYYYLLDVKKGDIEAGSSIKDWMLAHQSWKDHMDIWDYFEKPRAAKAESTFTSAAQPSVPEI